MQFMLQRSIIIRDSSGVTQLFSPGSRFNAAKTSGTSKLFFVILSLYGAITFYVTLHCRYHEDRLFIMFFSGLEWVYLFSC